ncbi:TetR/AcrR family transcriptional regulator [Actinokineospora bangkokensis]|uniref:TetR family transcriptional regulator n=1 Tax=Actinokineospora bangkokensis TaxID=1193682 RepID=A0A1Q9LRY1_9PSEU|nr:TetR/AcrR family transcriptional regulator [Actinokineospora bangkokensis]OLR94796.1 TetR family transcriptional regulator [Actinokineospora bangkokensis]
MRKNDARTRVLAAASRLFYRDGIHAVGVDAVAAEAGVAKASLYGNFGSKNQLVVAYLRDRDQRWQERVDAITAAHTAPRDRVLALFDAYADWITGDGYRGCAFLNAAAEFPDPADPVREVVRHHKAALRSYLGAQLRETPDRADEVVLLLEGSAAAAVVAQDPQPFHIARRLAESLLA